MELNLDIARNTSQKHKKAIKKDNPREYKAVSGEMRVKLIVLIRDFHLSCYQAAKILGIAYNNAKVIYRTYKTENIILPFPRTFKELALQHNQDSEQQEILRKAWHTSRNLLLKKMRENFFTERELAKISQLNFDVLITSQALRCLSESGYDWCNGYQFVLTPDGRRCVVLPEPKHSTDLSVLSDLV